MRRVFGVVGAVTACLIVPALVSAQVVKDVKPEPAWCGGAWEPPMLREVVSDGKTSRVPVPGTGGTNFGPCLPLTREVRGVDGKVSVVVIPTYPSHPASMVTFQLDPKTGQYRGGRMLTQEGKDGKPVTRWVEIEPKVMPSTK